MELIKFITPFYYTFTYNRKGLEGLAYFLEYTILPFIVLMLWKPVDMTIFQLMIIVSVITISYEVGYIYNNVIVIDTEDNPSLRHTRYELQFANQYIFCIIFIRLILIVVLMSGLLYINTSNAVITSIGVLLIMTVFYLYNTIRQGWGNRILFFLLRFIRYYFVLFFIGMPAFIISSVIAIVNLINNLAWYPERTDINLPRLFGTKVFDGLIYMLFAAILFWNSYEIEGYLFSYLSSVKLGLFGYKYIMMNIDKGDQHE